VSKHTPGPWHCNHECDTILDAGGFVVALVSRISDRAAPEIHANGILIAAPPDMLEALEAIEGMCRRCERLDIVPDCSEVNTTLIAPPKSR